MYSPSLYYKMPSGCPFSEGTGPMPVVNLQGERREEEKKWQETGICIFW